MQYSSTVYCAHLPRCVWYSISVVWYCIVSTDAELVLFGSSANEFGTDSSDIDISMKLPGHFEVLYIVGC